MLDPFCKCAATLEVAYKLKRQWIGINDAIHAVKRMAAIWLRDHLELKEGTDFILEGIPRTLKDARDPWDRDPYHFQRWAIEQSDGFVTTSRTADGSIRRAPLLRSAKHQRSAKHGD